MKTIGLLGGMSWESSIEYYRLVNVEVRERLGGLHSADCLLRSVDRRLRDRHGLKVLVPEADDRRLVHEVIYRELCVGVVDPGSRDQYRRVMADLAGRGAECILLGCTEIDLLVGPQDAPVPVFDTTRLHARRAVELALAG